MRETLRVTVGIFGMFLAHFLARITVVFYICGDCIFNVQFASACMHNIVAGNAASLLLYAAPIVTFTRVVKRRSTEKFSCIPYILALLNSLLYTWYGFPVMSCRRENLLLVTINGLGVLFETSFIFIYLCFAPPDQKKLVSLLLVPVIVIFSITALVSSFVLHQHHHRKVFVGSIRLVASASMYGSPLVAVIKTKRVEFMPFYLSFFTFLASSLWMAYGLLGQDLLLAAPNLLGCPFGVLQLVLYFIYRNSKGPSESPDQDKIDLENGTKHKLQQQQEVLIGSVLVR